MWPSIQRRRLVSPMPEAIVGQLYEQGRAFYFMKGMHKMMDYHCLVSSLFFLSFFVSGRACKL
jgi:hypothetical protein